MHCFEKWLQQQFLSSSKSKVIIISSVHYYSCDNKMLRVLAITLTYPCLKNSDEIFAELRVS